MMRAGQCKELSLDSRRIIAKLVVAIAEGRPQAEVAAAFRACGARFKHFSEGATRGFLEIKYNLAATCTL